MKTKDIINWSGKRFTNFLKKISEDFALYGDEEVYIVLVKEKIVITEFPYRHLGPAFKKQKLKEFIREVEKDAKD